MGIDDLVGKGRELFEENKDKVEGALGSDKAEEISDKILDGVAGAAKRIIPADHHGKIDEVRDNVDKSIGKE